MKTIDKRRYEMFVRVRDFGNTYGHLFPKSSLAGETFAAVGGAAKQLSEHAVSKMATANGGASARATAREELREMLETFSRTAREIAQDAPEVTHVFQLAPSADDQELLTAGRLFVRDAEPLRAQFIAHALPQTFLPELRKLVDRFEQVLRDADADRSANTAAVASIDAAITSGFAAVRKLDVIVANVLGDDPVTMAVWQRDRRVRYRGRVKPPAREAEGQSATTTETAAKPAAAPEAVKAVA